MQRPQYRHAITFELLCLVWLCIRLAVAMSLEPQPQLQPVAQPGPAPYAEPPRPLEIKPGRQPLDLKPAPRPQLDLRPRPVAPTPDPRSLISQNPAQTLRPLINNPLGYAPGRALISPILNAIEATRDPYGYFGIPADDVQPLELAPLPSPTEFPIGAIDNGPELVPAFPGAPNPLVGGDFQAYGGISIRYTVVLINQQRTRQVRSYQLRNRTQTPEQYVDIVWVECDGQTRQDSVRVFNPNNGFLQDYRNTITIIGNQACGPGAPLPTGSPQPAQRLQNSARAALAPANLPAPAARDRPFTPLPIPFFVRPRLDTPEQFEDAPTDPDKAFIPGPLFVPTRPGAPGEPFKLPPVPAVPQLPGETETPPRAPTKRPPPVEFPPADPENPRVPAPPSTPVRPPLIPIPPLRRDDCCADRVVLQESRKIQDAIDDVARDLLDRCIDLCDPADLTKIECQDVNGELRPVTVIERVITLARGLEVLAGEISSIKRLLDPCSLPPLPPAPVTPYVMASGTMTEAETVAYVPAGPDVRQVELIVTGQIPQYVRLYDTTQSGEQQGKFGSICVAYPGVTGGHAPEAFHQWAWTRRTSLYLGEAVRPDRKVRIYLRAGLSWVLYDTGLRN